MNVLQCFSSYISLVINYSPFCITAHGTVTGYGKFILKQTKVVNKPLNVLICCLQTDGICRFPSEYFYDGKLKTVKKSEWFDREDHVLTVWPNKGFPMVFCHVEGTEVTQTVSTPEGNEQSKRNDKECSHVVRIS